MPKLSCPHCHRDLGDEPRVASYALDCQCPACGYPSRHVRLNMSAARPLGSAAARLPVIHHRPEDKTIEFDVEVYTMGDD